MLLYSETSIKYKKVAAFITNNLNESGLNNTLEEILSMLLKH